MRRQDESWSVPLIAARAWSADHAAGGLTRDRRPRVARRRALLVTLRVWALMRHR